MRLEEVSKEVGGGFPRDWRRFLRRLEKVPHGVGEGFS